MAGVVRVLILNTVALNGGDGAILIALLEGLRKHLGPETSFVVHEAQPDAARRYYPGTTFRPTADAALGSFPRSRMGDLRRRLARRLFRAAAGGGIARSLARWLLPSTALQALQDYLDADVVISTGGTYLVEHYDMSGRILSFESAIAAAKPLLLYTQSLGPFNRPDSRMAMARVVSGAGLVLLRDELSYRHLAELGIDTGNLRVVPDSAFSLAEPGRLRMAAERRRPGDVPVRVAISVRDWSHFRSRSQDEGMAHYLDAIGGLVTHLVEVHGARVTFLSTCQGVPEYAHDDSRTARLVVDRLDQGIREFVTVDADFHGAEGLLQELPAYDIVVSTRMHFAILALISGVPVIPIAYEFKMRELFDGIGQAELVHDIESVTASALIQSVDRLLDEEQAVRQQLFQSVTDAHLRAAGANELLARNVSAAISTGTV